MNSIQRPNRIRAPIFPSLSWEALVPVADPAETRDRGAGRDGWLVLRICNTATLDHGSERPDVSECSASCQLTRLLREVAWSTIAFGATRLGKVSMGQ